MNKDLREILEKFGLTSGETRVYEALLALKVGTKTPLVRASDISPSKVYDVLDKLMKKGLATSFVENSVMHYVPVHPSNLAPLFDQKMEEIQRMKQQLEKNLSFLGTSESFLPPVQLFRGWNGLRNVFNIVLSDLRKGDTYYILGATGGEDTKKAYEFFPSIDEKFYKKKIKRKALLRFETKSISEEYFKKFGRKNWEARYFSTLGPFEIGISNSYVALNLMENEPVSILLTHQKIRDSFLGYFQALWMLSKV